MLRPVLVACENSQEITGRLIESGINAYSCDVLPCSGPYPEKHLQFDVRECLWFKWSAVIAHPPCTFLTSSNTYIGRGCSKYTPKEAIDLRKQAIEFFMLFTRLPCRYAIENPVGIMSRLYRKPDQYIQPYEYGDDASKKTCLWLQEFPPLIPDPADYVQPRIVDNKKRWANQTDSGQNRLPPSEERSNIRSKTYPGIARAIVEQWFLSPQRRK